MTATKYYNYLNKNKGWYGVQVSFISWRKSFIDDESIVGVPRL